MKNHLNLKTVVVCAVTLLGIVTLLSPVAFAGDQGEKHLADSITLTGTLTVVLDDQSQVDSAQLMTDEAKVFKIITDENGIKLAEEADGKKVEVTGTLIEKEGQLWLKVIGWKVVLEGQR